MLVALVDAVFIGTGPLVLGIPLAVLARIIGPGTAAGGSTTDEPRDGDGGGADHECAEQAREPLAGTGQQSSLEQPDDDPEYE
jgi:hypothetical protein